MNEEQALRYAARLLEAEARYSYYPHLDHAVAIEVLNDLADRDYRRQSLEASMNFDKENG